MTPQERLRVALLLDRPYPAPTLDQDTLSWWLQELAGPHRLRPQELSLLWSRYGELAPAEQSWLAQIEARRAPTELRLKLPELLRNSVVTPELAELAVRLGVELPEALLESQHDSVRAHAVAAGLADGRLEVFWVRRRPSRKLGPPPFEARSPGSSSF